MARKFTATTDRVAYGTLAFPTVLTMGCFVRAIPADASERMLLHFSTNFFSVVGDSTHNLKLFREYATTPGDWRLAAAAHGTNFNDGFWHSIVYSHNGAAAPGAAGDMDMWIDGVDYSSSVTLNVSPAGALAAGPWYFTVGNNAQDGTATTPAGGEICLAWYGDRAPTQAEVSYFNSTGIPPFSSANLLEFWPLDGAASPEPALITASHAATVTGATSTNSPQLTQSIDEAVLGKQRTTMPMIRGPRGDTILGMGVRTTGLRVADVSSGTELRLYQSLYIAQTYEKSGTGAIDLIGSGASATGGTTYTKAGAGAMGLVGSGADVAEFTEAGAGTSAFVGSGADAVTSVETGAGVSALVGSGADVATYVEAASGISARVGSGADVATYVEAAAGITAFVGSGADVANYNETGAGVSPRVGSGADVATYVEAGAGITAFAGFGADIVTSVETGSGVLNASGSGASSTSGGTTFTKAGSGVSAFAGSGADAVTSTETGTGVSPHAGSGLDAITSVETGSGIRVHTASGTRVLTWVVTGRGVIALIGSGAKDTSIPVEDPFDPTEPRGQVGRRGGSSVLGSGAGGQGGDAPVLAGFDSGGPGGQT